MSNVQGVQEKSVRAEAGKDHFTVQSEQWREIGITAVAAAARYAGQAKSTAGAEPKKVVTLRDIEHFAA